MLGDASEDSVGSAQKAYRDELTALAPRVGKYVARRALFKTPAGLEGAEAEEYGNRRRVALLPLAWEIMERAMKGFTPSREELEAARLVIESNGQGKQEARVGGNAPLINIAIAGPLPWQSNATNATVTVDAPVSKPGNSLPATPSQPAGKGGTNG